MSLCLRCYGEEHIQWHESFKSGNKTLQYDGQMKSKMTQNQNVNGFKPLKIICLPTYNCKLLQLQQLGVLTKCTCVFLLHFQASIQKPDIFYRVKNTHTHCFLYKPAHQWHPREHRLMLSVKILSLPREVI